VPYNAAGLYSLIASYFASPGSTIRTEQHNPVFEDVASALSSVLLRDGRAPMSGPLNMNGFAINNIAPGNSSSSVATLGQSMPIGAVIDFAGASAPAGWALCFGQAVSRSTYATLFALIGTTYGTGDGSTTFNLPDMRGRVVAGKDDMGGSAAGRVTTAGGGIDGTVLGASGGNQSLTLSQANLPAATLPVDIPAGQGSHNHGYDRPSPDPVGGAGFNSQNPGYGKIYPGSSTGNATLPAMSGTASLGGSGTPILILSPSIVINKIIRVSYDG
jgi:microcystin-dependent protein